MIYEFLLFTLSLLPVLIIGFFLYYRDKKKEPMRLLLKLFIGGIGSCYIAIIIGKILFPIFPILSTNNANGNAFKLFISVFIGIALKEEFAKWIMVYLISYKSRYLENLYDMMLYCVFVALGFAFYENLLYIFNASISEGINTGIKTGLLRAVLSVPGHSFDGLFMGYFLGLSKIDMIRKNFLSKKRNLLFSIIVPMICHGIYDFCLFVENNSFLIVFGIFVLTMYIVAIVNVLNNSKNIKRIKFKDNFCPQCGQHIETEFCPSCGRKNE